MGKQRRGSSIGISYCHVSWNPQAGCEKVSLGCKYCWASDASAGLARKGQAKHEGLTILTNGGHSAYNGTLRFDSAVLNQPYGWKKPMTVFANTVSDTFHVKAPRRWQDDTFAVMDEVRRHRYLTLTKRPDVMLEYVKERAAKGLPVLPHVWLGFSAETQKLFDERWAYAKQVADLGWGVWVSVEPQLEKVTLGNALNEGLAWVVTGGESTMPYADARPYELEWAESLVAECKGAGVAVFMKQLGVNPWRTVNGVKVKMTVSREGKHLAEWPESIRVQEFPSREEPEA